MAIYRNICYKIEDLFVKMLSRKDDQSIVKIKVNNYRSEKEKHLQQNNRRKKSLV